MNNILESRLDKLRRSLDEVSNAVDDNLRTVLHQLTCDAAAVNLPLKSIDPLGKAVRENCMLLMAKEHPFASDLKFGMAALRLEHDYDRIQELIEALNRRVSFLRGSQFREICQDMTGVMADILSMHEIVRQLWQRPRLDSDEELLTANQAKLYAGIQVSILTIQNKILQGISAEKRDSESIVEMVLACRHLKRIASSLNGMPEEMHSFG